MKIQAVKERAVFEKILVKQQLVQFQIDCGASVSILPLKCSQTLVMWDGSKMKSVGTCAFKGSEPQEQRKVQSQISGS